MIRNISIKIDGQDKYGHWCNCLSLTKIESSRSIVPDPLCIVQNKYIRGAVLNTIYINAKHKK